MNDFLIVASSSESDFDVLMTKIMLGFIGSVTATFKAMKNILIIIFMCLFFGCATTNDNYFVFPTDLKDQCYNCLKQAQNIIENKGVKATASKPVTVNIKPGRKFYGDSWAFYSPEWNQDICGIAYLDLEPIIVEVACNPQDVNDINFSVLTHEFAHYLLFINERIDFHDPRFANDFLRWYDIRSKYIMLVSEKGRVIVDFAK